LHTKAGLDVFHGPVNVFLEDPFRRPAACDQFDDKLDGNPGSHGDGLANQHTRVHRDSIFPVYRLSQVGSSCAVYVLSFCRVSLTEHLVEIPEKSRFFVAFLGKVIDVNFKHMKGQI
jgi:hypothetical protein